MKRARVEDDEDDAAPVLRQYAQVGTRGPAPPRGNRTPLASGGRPLAPTGLDPRWYNTTGGGHYARDGPYERASEVDADQVNYAAGIAAGAANIDYTGGRRATTLIGGPYHGTFGPDDRGQPMGGEYIPRGPLTVEGVYGRGPRDPATGRMPLQSARTHHEYRERFGEDPEGFQEFNPQVLNRVAAHDNAARERMRGPMNEAEYNAYAEQITGLDPAERPQNVYNHPPKKPRVPIDFSYPPGPYGPRTKAEFRANQLKHRAQRLAHGMSPFVPQDPTKHF